nr:pentatricopeptide repeat-containing protein At1g74600, chloroplastic [Ipomoea batatas]
MPECDVISWNTVISGLNRSGFPRKSLYFYKSMVSQGITENSSTFSSVLSICNNAGFYRKGFEIQCRVVVFGLDMNIYIVSALVDLYMKVGLIEVALKLFYGLPERNLTLWNIVLRGICDLGRSKELLRLYTDMKLAGVEPNGLSFCYLLSGCGSGRFLLEGRQIHCFVLKNGWLVTNLFLANGLVDFYSACGVLSDARKSFEVIPPEDVISWSSMVSVYAANGLLQDALKAFEKMQSWAKRPSAQSFLGLLNLLSSRKELLLGEQIHCFVLKLGFDYGNALIQSALINMYGKCGHVESSVSLFENAPEASLESCNSLMTSLLHCNVIEDVLELFGFMVDESIGFDEVSLSSTLKALSLLASVSLNICALLHCCAIKVGFEYDIVVSCSLVDAYSKSGHIEHSDQIFRELPSPNAICFTAMINAYARLGKGSEALEMFGAMIQQGLKPDEVTLLCVLMGCSHSGMVEEARTVFDSMRTHHGINPDRRHYSCMVDLLGRRGLVSEAEELMNCATVDGDAVMWSSLLRSCRTHKNEQVGRRVAEKLMKLEAEEAAVWLQVSNFYCEIGDFDTSVQIREVAMARKMSREIGGAVAALASAISSGFDPSRRGHWRHGRRQGAPAMEATRKVNGE